MTAKKTRHRLSRPRADKPCTYCGEPSIAKDLCYAHYNRQRYGKVPMDEPIRRPKACDVPWCEESTILEYCLSHMDNYRYWGSPVASFPVTQEAVDLFWSKVLIRQRGECWPWQGTVNRSNKKGAGYGTIEGSNGRLAYAHHIAWRLVNRAPIPAGKVISWPECQFTLCMNAYDHLKAVTRKELAEIYKRRST